MDNLNPKRKQVRAECKKIRIDLGLPPTEFTTWEEAADGNEVIFKHKFEDIHTYLSVGWSWIPK